MLKRSLSSAAVLVALGFAFASSNASASASFNTIIDTPTELKVQWSGTLADFNSVTIIDPTYWDVLGFDLTLTTTTKLGKTFTNWDAVVEAQHDSAIPAHPHAGDNPLGPVFFSDLSGKLGASGFDAEKSPHNQEAWVAWSNAPVATNAHWDHYSFSVTTNLDGTGTATLYAIHPVPEPESYAMFLAGLGIMGAVARRRTKSA